MRSPNELAQDYIDLWNEPNAAKRATLFARTWTQEASYSDPMMKGRGAAEIDGLIAAVQDRFPGFVFTLLGSPNGYEDVARFSWALGPEVGDAIVKGTDIVHRDGDRIVSVTGFLDAAPSSA